MTETRQRSDRQKAASRENGAKSPGPKSDKGKAKSARNSKRHGLTGRSIEPDDAEREEIDELRRKLLRRYKLLGRQKGALIERVLVASIRLGRARALITARLQHIAQPENSSISREQQRAAEYMQFAYDTTREVFGEPADRVLLKAPAEQAGHIFETKHLQTEQLNRLEAYAKRFRGERDRALKKLELMRNNSEPAIGPLRSDGK